MILVRKSRLFRIRVTNEPVQQLSTVGRDDVELRIMDVAVDQTRNNQFAAVILDRRIVAQLRQQLLRGAQFRYHAIFDNEQSIVEVGTC